MQHRRPRLELNGPGLAWVPPGLPGVVAANLVVAALYAALGAAAGLFFARYGLFPAPIWLPAGLAAVAAMLGGALLAPGLFAGSLAVNYLLLDTPIEAATLISLSNALGPLAGALLTRRLRPATGLFTRLRGVLGFVAGSVVLHGALTGAGGTAALVVTGLAPAEAAYAILSHWWLSDAGGVFFFAPAVMLWLGAERTPAIPGQTPRPADRLVLAATAGLAALIFTLPAPALLRPDAMFLLTIPITWVTLRISLRAAYTLLTLISVVATIGTLAGLGPFQAEGVANPLRAVGLMIVLMATNALTLMALVSERREAEALLAEGNARLAAEVAARTAELRQRADTDDLTGIGNRGCFLRRLEEAFGLARMQGTKLALVLLDIDHLRPLNDTRGHEAGDAVLRRVAALGREQLEGWEASFGRIGGEVFAIALPGAGAPEGASLAEGLRAAVARHSFTFAGDAASPPPSARLTISLGVTALLPGDRAAADLLRRADAAVFLAKAKGRNRVETRLASEVPQEMRASNLSR